MSSFSFKHLCLVLLVASVVGCGPPVGSVTGVVSHQGKPLNSGVIRFKTSNGEPRDSEIGVDGSYTIKQASVGLAKISVFVGSAGQSDAPIDPEGAIEDLAPEQSAPVSIPEKYADFDSGLTYEITSGQQSHNIELP